LRRQNSNVVVDEARARKDQPLRRWLATRIKQEYQEGRYSPGNVLESERALCEKYKVSRVTVRAALDLLEGEGLVRKHPGRCAVVTDGPAVELRPRGRAQRHLRRLAFIRLSSNAWTSEMSQGFVRHCQESGLEFLVLDAHGSHETLLRYLRQPASEIGGVMLISYDTPEYKKALRDVIRREIEVVCLDRVLADVPASSVTVDNFAGAYLATKHLLESWNRSVFYIGYRKCASSMHQRMHGWRSALDEHGVHDWDQLLCEIDMPEEILSLSVEHSFRVGHDLALKLFSEKQQVQRGWSVFAMKDAIARGVYAAAEQLGLKVGRDVALVGFGNSFVGQQLSPPLSSVDRPREKLGYAGAKLLHQRMLDPGKPPIHQVLPVSLMIRESSVGPGREADASSPTNESVASANGPEAGDQEVVSVRS